MNQEEQQNTKRLEIHYGSLDETNFMRHPVWFEYEVPEQIEFLMKIGISETWLRRNIVEFTNTSNRSVWFAMDALFDVPATTVCAAFANISLGKSISYDGYITVVDGFVTSCRIFDGNILLSKADVLDEDNRAALETIATRSGIQLRDLLPIQYEIFVELDRVKSEEMQIPRVNALLTDKRAGTE